MSNNENFSDFYERWINQQENHYQMLSQLSNQPFECDHSNKAHVEAMVESVIAHHKEYYTFKWAVGHQNVLPFFWPPWLTRLESASLWFTGWKPLIAFRILDMLKQNKLPDLSLAELTQDQLEKIEKLKIEILTEERKVERDMERQQMVITYVPMRHLTRMVVQVNDGEPPVADIDALMDDHVKSLVVGLEKVMKRADYARLKTLKLVLEILDLKQCVQFLGGLAYWHMQSRKGSFQKKDNSN